MHKSYCVGTSAFHPAMPLRLRIACVTARTPVAPPPGERCAHTLLTAKMPTVRDTWVAARAATTPCFPSTLPPRRRYAADEEQPLRTACAYRSRPLWHARELHPSPDTP